MIKKSIALCAASLIALGMTGCAEKDPKPQVVVHKIKVNKPKPYQFNLKPQIGTRNDDARTVVDMGVVLKISVNSYKNRYGNLVASHDNYIWAKRPDFIVGESLPERRATGTVTPSRDLPFMLSNEEIDRSDIQSDETIKEYVNQVYTMQNSEEAAVERKTEASKYDDKIKEFLKRAKKNQLKDGNND